jgi:hypothetical protein
LSIAFLQLAICNLQSAAIVNSGDDYPTDILRA